MCYTIPTSGAIFMAKTSVDSPGYEHVWTYSVLGDGIYEMKKVTE